MSIRLNFVRISLFE